MSRLAFSLGQHDVEGQISAYRSVVAKECFDGDVSILPETSRHRFLLEKGASAPVTMLSLRATMNSSMRRSWQHIRAGDRHCYAIWLLRSGRLRMTHSAGTQVTEEGRIAVMDSGSPFVSEALVNANMLHSSLFAVVPAHLFRRYIHDFHGMAGAPFASQGGDGRTVRDILTLLYDEGDNLDREAGLELLGVALKALGRLIEAKIAGPPPRQSIREIRLRQIEAHVDLHLTDASLTATGAAAALGITPRYLCYLLNDTGTHFSTLVHRKRQELAREWLLSPDMQHISVAEIGAMAGYKSTAQFSRVFRSVHGCAPTELRSELYPAAKSQRA